MRRGTSAGFWRKYEYLQLSMTASCMPKTAVVSATKPMQIKTPLAFCALPGRIPATPVHLN